ncbi:MAG TPA: polysaccharide biosynthesis/export family protein [Verrucomicrobiae bacterium]|nr:polysaccharide biosynthesis/export family protein [Verrucomicrobiae bacterium]
MITPMKLFRKTLGTSLFACSMLLAGFILTGCAPSYNNPVFTENPPPISSADMSSTKPASYLGDAARFHVGETVIVDFSGLPSDALQDMPEHQEPIKEDGKISLPYIGTIQAAGKTPGELQTEIQNLYVPHYFVRLNVTVKSQDRVYYVGGEVKLPNRYLYSGQTTVTQAIQAAGDFTDFANRGKVWLIRSNGQRIKVNCNKALQDPSQDPPVYPGDQIQVPRRLW